MAYDSGSGVNAIGGLLRGQNIGVSQGALNRTQAEQISMQQDALARAQMAQQNEQFGITREDEERRRADAAKQAAQDRLYGLLGGIGGVSGKMAGTLIDKYG